MSKEIENMKVQIKDFKDLLVWQKSMVLSDKVYNITKDFPAHELYGIRAQIQRASTSISANVSEGNGQLYKKKEYNFFNNALGSASEVRNWLEQARRRGYIDDEIYEQLEKDTVEVIKMILGYMKRLKALISSSGTNIEG